MNNKGVKACYSPRGKANEAAAEALPGGQLMVQGGRRMGGFFFVAEKICDAAMLKDRVSLALSYVTTLPPK